MRNRKFILFEPKWEQSNVVNSILKCMHDFSNCNVCDLPYFCIASLAWIGLYLCECAESDYNHEVVTQCSTKVKDLCMAGSCNYMAFNTCN